MVTDVSSLEALADEAQKDPNNTWLARKQVPIQNSYVAPPNTADAAAYGDISPEQATSGFAPRKPAASAVTGPLPSIMDEQQPITLPETKVKGTVGGIASTTKPSPSRENLAGHEASDIRLKEGYEEQQGQLEAQRAQYEDNIKQSYDMGKAAYLNDQAAQSEIQTMQRNAYYDAKKTSDQDSLDAQNLRAQKPDPNAWFKSKGTAGTILAALSMAAGAFAAAMPHTTNHENQAGAIIDKAVERDVQSQEADLANKWKALNFKGAAHQQDYTRNQYMIEQRQRLTNQGYQHVLFLAEDMRRKTTDQLQVANLDNAIMGIKQKIEGTFLDSVDRRTQVQLLERAQSGGSQVSPKQLVETALTLAKENPGMTPAEAMAASSAFWRTGGKGYSKPLLGSKGNANAQEAVFQGGLSQLDKLADDAMASSGIITSIGGAITPGGTEANDKRGILKSEFMAQLKPLEPRMDEKQREETWTNVDPTVPGLSDAQKQQRKQAMIDTLSHAASGQAGKKATIVMQQDE